MIIEMDKGNYLDNKDVQIIFNPVSASKSNKAKEIFNEKISSKYFNVYEDYEDYKVGESVKRLLSDIQLVQVEDDLFILNAFVYERDSINLLALTKTLVELFNICEEYKLNASINTKFKRCKRYKESIDLIINTVFEDFSHKLYLY